MAKGRIATYHPREVIISFGNHMIDGYADDSFVSIEPNGDGITKKVGCDGEIARSVNPDDTYVVKITLLQTSLSNTFFQQQYNHDYDTGEGMEPLLIKDLKGTMLFSTDYAWVSKVTSRGFGKDTTNREWEIHTASGVLTE